MIPGNTQALARYNSLFNNQQYQAIADQLAIDLRLQRDSMRVSNILNCVTDTALSLCQHSHYADAWIKLATLCGQNGISIVTIDMIYNYLLIYQQPSDTRTEDFQMTAKGLLKAYEATDALRFLCQWCTWLAWTDGIQFAGSLSSPDPRESVLHP